MPKEYHNFYEFVAGLSNYSDNTALTIRRFIRLETYSYKELQRKIYQTANYLKNENIKAGDRIMIVGLNSPEWVMVFLAAQILGIVAVTVDVASTETTIKKFADITTPSHLFCSNDLSKIQGLKSKIVNLGSIGEKIDKFDAVVSKQVLSGDEGTIIVFTSGTTADPKGVVLTQRNILSNLKAILSIFDVNPSWQFLSVLPLSHMYELNIGCLLPLYVGGGIHYIPRVTPLAISKAMKEYKVTVLASVPQLAGLMMKKIEKTAEQKGISAKLNLAFKIAPYLPHGLRRVLFKQVLVELGGRLDILALGGAAPDVDMVKKWELMGVKVVQGYGLTETSPLLAGNIIPKRRVDSQGFILSNIKWKLSEENELLVKGPSVFGGYYKNPAATSTAFTTDGYFKTGDIGKVDAGGWLYLNGRAKFAIVLSSGLKVFPEDVEFVAQKNEILKNICVVGVKSSNGEIVEAVVVSDKSDKELEQAISLANSQLESFQHIDRWVRWEGEDFPRNRLLKIDRKTVVNWANDQKTKPEQTNKSAAETKDSVLNIIQKVLDQPGKEIKEVDKLSDAGLDSLRRLMLVSVVEEELGVAINETNITQHTTLKDLRVLIESSPAAVREEAQPEWQYRSFVRVCGNFFRDFFLHNLAKIWVRYKVTGLDNIKGLENPVLVVFNHNDYFDVTLTYDVLPRKIRNRLAVAAANDILKKYKSINFFSRFAYSGFALARKEPILPSLKYAASLVSKGWSVAIAPEGKISTDGKLQEFKSGIGLLAVELGVPVVCITTSGLYGTMSITNMHPKKHYDVKIAISKPLVFSKKTSYDEATKKIRQIAVDQIDKMS